jgi:hypothetical protein
MFATVQIVPCALRLTASETDRVPAILSFLHAVDRSMMRVLVDSGGEMWARLRSAIEGWPPTVEQERRAALKSLAVTSTEVGDRDR